jgi:hypothetical protein
MYDADKPKLPVLFGYINYNYAILINITSIWHIRTLNNRIE